MERFQGLRNYLFPSRGRISKFQTDLPLSTDVCLIVSGGVMLIVGLLVLIR
jgi:hypothetical protein